MDEDRDLAEPFNCCVGELLRALAFRKIGLLDIRAEHLRAFLLQRLGDGAANAARRAGHQRRITFKQHR
jgi:hypothetical protein